MPKLNFNQFLDECEHFKTFENKTISKISFETNHPDREYETENQSQSQNQSATSNYNTSFSEKYSNATSSNIFLSNNANGHSKNRFSTNRPSHNYNSVAHIRRENSGNNNMFKKMDTNQTEIQCFGVLPSPPTSHTLEINNETFPSLVPTPISNTNNNTVPKKFKNFKDAICSSTAEPALSPTKQKQLKKNTMEIKQSRSNVTHIPPPIAVKKDSEMYAKKILAKIKNLAMDYDNYDDDDDDSDYNARDKGDESLYKCHYKQTFIKKRYNDDDDCDSDD